MLIAFAVGVCRAQPDSEFHVDVQGGVGCLAVQSDGRIILGGDLQKVNGEPRRGLARIHRDGSLDPGFSPDATYTPVTPNPWYVGNINYGAVRTLAIQTDGRILVGGSLTNLAGQPRTFLGRLNPDGSLDPSFAPQFAPRPGGDGGVSALAVQPDGKILVGGAFQGVNGVERTNLVRLNVDGTLDAAFVPTPPTNDWAGYIVPVIGILIKPDGRIHVTAGESFGGSVSRLLQDGALDPEFGVQHRYFGPDTMALVRDSRLLVGGTYAIPADGDASADLLMFDPFGTEDPAFNFAIVDTDYYSGLSSLYVQCDGKVVISGFGGDLAGPGRVGNIGRLFPDGNFDPSYFPLPGYGSPGPIVPLPDGRTIAGLYSELVLLTNTEPGTQSLELDGTTLRWHRGGTSPEVWRTSFEVSTNGTDWTSLGDGTPVAGGWVLSGVIPPPNASVRARGFLSGTPNSGWFIESGLGAPFLNGHPDSQTRNAGSTARFFVSAEGSGPFSYQWFKDGVDLGDEGNISGTTTARLVVSNVFAADEGGYSVVVHSDSGSVTSQVAQLTVVDPYIVTHPANADVNEGESARFEVEVLGTNPLGYQWYHDGMLLPGETNASLILDNVARPDIGGYHVGVANPQGSSTSTVALLTVNLSRADGFAPQLNSYPLSFAEEPDHSLLLVGQFTTVDGTPRRGISRLDAEGGLDLGFDPGTVALAQTVTAGKTAIAIQPDGRILIGGEAYSRPPHSPTNLARLHPNGTLDESFQLLTGEWGVQGTTHVNALAIQPDGNILVGGDWLLYGQAYQVETLWRLLPDGSLDPGFRVLWGWGEDVFTVGLQPDGNILVGGSEWLGPGLTRFTRVRPDGTWDPDFAGNIGSLYYDPTYPVYCSVLQPDGRILVGGRFVGANGQTRRALVRLNPDGTLDPGFNTIVALTNSPSEPSVQSMALQADGRIIVGGMFNSVDGHPRSNLARLNPDGSVDLSFNPGAGSTVHALALQSDGRILVGGTFTNIAGLNRRYLARLNNTEPSVETLTATASSLTWLRDGTAPEIRRATFEYCTNGLNWTPLGAGERIPGGWRLADITVPVNATLRARGSTSGGRYNGSTWQVESSFGPAAFAAQPMGRTNAAGTVATLTAAASGSGPITFQWLKNGEPLTDDDRVLGATRSTLTLSGVLGGDEGDYQVVACNSFGCITSSIAPLAVLDPAIHVQPVSQLADAGEDVVLLVEASGTDPVTYQWRQNGVAVPGSTAPTLDLPGIQAAAGGDYDVVVQSPFGRVTSLVARVEVNLTLPDLTFDPSASSSVYSLAEQPDGKILMGGNFVTVSGQAHSRVARLNPDGSPDATFLTRASSYVSALAVQTDGKILLGGNFTAIDTFTRRYVARLLPSGAVDPAFNPNANGWVSATVIQPDGKILICGSFTQVGGFTRNRIARLNANGSLDLGFDPDANNQVACMALQPDGKVVVGGAFTMVRGEKRDRIARLNPDGTLDPDFDPGASGSVWTLAIQADGRILAGGTFTSSFGGKPRNRIARLYPDGSLDEGFDPDANGSVSCLTVQTDGRILVGGSFTELGGRPRNQLGRLLPDGTPDGNFRADADYSLDALAILANGDILAGGYFRNLAGQSRNCIGRLINPQPATDQLLLNGSTLRWQRGGGGPEAWRTTFETSPDGVSWVNAGTGIRTQEGWRLGGLSLPTRVWIRARAFVTGGDYGSGWFVERVMQSTAPFVTRDPQNLWVNEGDTATFNVSVSSLLPVSYQWCFNTDPLNGETNMDLVLPGVTPLDSGLYSVKVSNLLGSATSAGAMLVVNALPVADASATQLRWISPNNTNATAILDGTLSSDPDNELLEYLWFEPGAVHPLATGVVAVITLPVGTHEIELRVSDGAAVDSDIVIVEVLTSAEAVSRILALVNESNAWPRRSLNATLSAARASIERNHPVPAIHQLLAFQNQVRAQVLPVDPGLAALLIDRAREVIDALGTGEIDGPGKSEVRVVLKEQEMRLQLTVPAGRIHVIEASTDLVDWRPIAVAHPGPNGECEFKDPDAARFPQRYYRVVTP